jgi:predicted Rossmann-fold nucleotide-binding protein
VPGGFGTLDAPAEILTLIQTGKTRRIPVILVQSDFWEGLIDWFKAVLVEQGMINAEDLDLFKIIDTPDEVADAIFDHYEQRGFEPSRRERKVLMDL